MTFTISIQGNSFRKWDMIKSYSSDSLCYVIGKKKSKGSVTLKLFPYEKQDSKFAQFVWFYLLKMLVFIKMI